MSENPTNPSPPSTPLHRDLLAEVDAGNVSRTVRGPLAIYNYTANCNFGRHWTPTTLAARGLILEEATSRVVARPFEKFFNMNEREETRQENLPWDEPFEVTEKLDGSLGIVFFYDGRWDIATRGAFESEQAVYARERLLPRYDFQPLGEWPAWTLLTEIVYPGNRIVVDYRSRNELVLLAARGTMGRAIVASADREVLGNIGLAVGMGVVKTGVIASAIVTGSAVDQASTDPTEIDHEPNTEGYVLYWPGRDLRIKIKAPDYVAAHRCLDLVSPKRVLELIVEGRDDDVAAQLPDHVRPTFDAIREDLNSRTMGLLAHSAKVFGDHESLLPDRKTFAMAIRGERSELKPLIFKRADGKGDDALLDLARNLVAKQLREGEAL